MTNPNNAIGTNGAYGGRTSVNAFNDDLAVYVSRGILSGFAVSPNTGMSVSIGGNGTARDVAIAQDNAGNRTSINNISAAPVSISIPGAPASNSRIDSIVAYVANPPQGSSSTTDNSGACGLIVVSGATAATPVAPSDGDIRTAITGDGASGSTAYYVILGSVIIASGTTDITSNMIAQGDKAILNTSATIADSSITTAKIGNSAITTGKINNGAVTSAKIANNSVTKDKIDWTTMPGSYSTSEVATPYRWTDSKIIYKKTILISGGFSSRQQTFNHNISNLGTVVNVEGMAKDATYGFHPITRVLPGQITEWGLGIADINTTSFGMFLGTAYTLNTLTAHVTFYYTKTS